MAHGINRMRFAGSWYPSEGARLRTLLERAVGESDRSPPESPQSGHYPRLAVLPHAGLSYSARGQQAFWARWAGHRSSWIGGAETRAPQVIIIAAPSHYYRIPPDTTVGAPFSGHETPLAELPGLDISLGDRDDAPMLEEEHALELLLPALAFHGITLPVGAVLTGAFTDTTAARAAAARLRERLRQEGIDPNRVLWLVSSDFTHYGPRFAYQPRGAGRYRSVGGPVAESDLALAENAARGDLEGFRAAHRGGSTVCGRYAIELALALVESEAAMQGSVLSYYTSADLAQDPGEEKDFVCYGTVEVTSP